MTSSKLTLTETFNLGCDIDLEHSNPTFSLDTSLLMMIYTQIEFGCKRLTGLGLIKKIQQKLSYFDYMSPHCDLHLEDRIPFFRMTFRLMVVHHNTKFGYKRLQTSTQPSGNKYVSRALHPSPLKTPQCFPFSSKIIHHTQREKRSNVAAASQLMWTGMLGQVEVNGTSRNNNFMCSHVTPL